MNRVSLIALAVGLLSSTAAMATDPHIPQTPSGAYAGITAEQNQAQLQGQLQLQGINESGNSTNTLGQSVVAGDQTMDGSGNSANDNTLRGGDQNASTRSRANSAVDGSGNAEVRVGVSGNNYNSRAVAWAPVIHGPGAAPLASGALAVIPGICGFRMKVVYEDVYGQRFGASGGRETFVQTHTEVVRPADGPPLISMNGYMIGHSVSTVAAIIGTSSAGSFSLGVFGKNGEGAQGGGAGGSSHQQLVTKVVLQDCVFAQPERVVQLPLPVPPALPTVPRVTQ